MSNLSFPAPHQKSRAQATASVVAALVGTLLGAGQGESNIRRYEAALQQKAAAIRHSAGERKWERIPWMTDLDSGWRAAQQENRPLCLWVSGDDPLERC